MTRAPARGGGDRTPRHANRATLALAVVRWTNKRGNARGTMFVAPRLAGGRRRNVGVSAVDRQWTCSTATAAGRPSIIRDQDDGITNHAPFSSPRRCVWSAASAAAIAAGRVRIDCDIDLCPVGNRGAEGDHGHCIASSVSAQSHNYSGSRRRVEGGARGGLFICRAWTLSQEFLFLCPPPPLPSDCDMQSWIEQRDATK
jgi:hypothetical protein